MDEEDQVTSADQQKINQFSRLNSRSHEIQEELELQRVRRARSSAVGAPAARSSLRALAPPPPRRRKPWRSSTTWATS